MITQVEQDESSVVRGVGGPSRLGVVGAVLAAVASILCIAGARAADTTLVSGYGLIPALPALYWIGVVVAVVATVVFLWLAATDEGNRYASGVPMLWLAILHTAPQLAHAHPRLPAAWNQVGLLRLLAETGGNDATIDSPLAWPGFHGAFSAPLSGSDAWLVESMLRIWPTVITGGIAVLVAVLAHRSYPTIPLIGSLSSLAYVLTAWVGHDHFAPLGVALLLSIAVVALLESGPLQTGTAWSGAVPVLPGFSTFGGDRPASRSIPVFVALIVLGLGVVVSHPIAPIFVCLTLAILGIHGRSLAWRLLVLIAVSFAVWFVAAGQPWWAGADGSSGSLLDGSLVDADTLAAPMAGASSDYRFVTDLRYSLTLATFASVLLMGVAMTSERFRHLRPAVPLVPLVVFPALILGLVFGIRSTGTLLALSFTLPFTSILIGRALASLPVRALPVVGGMIAAGLTPLLLLTRFGGERFEFVPAPDLAAVETAHNQAGDDTLLVADNRFVAWRTQGIGDLAFFEATAETSQAWIDRVEAQAAAAGRDRIIVVLTNGQLGWKIHGEGLDADSLDAFAEWLLQQPGSKLLLDGEGTWVIEL